MDGIYSIDGLAGGTVSDELQATLQAISETSDGHQIKFKPAVSRRLTRWIVCRSYTGPIHELCHLVHIASQIDRSADLKISFGDRDQRLRNPLDAKLEMALDLTRRQQSNISPRQCT